MLIEGSIFSAVKIRQQSRVLGLRTDRSAKYEKSLKNINLIESCYRLISLLRVSNPKLVCKLHTVTKTAENNIVPISLKYNTITQILGPIKTKNETSKNNNYIQI